MLIYRATKFFAGANLPVMPSVQHALTFQNGELLRQLVTESLVRMAV